MKWVGKCGDGKYTNGEERESGNGEGCGWES